MQILKYVVNNDLAKFPTHMSYSYVPFHWFENGSKTSFFLMRNTIKNIIIGERWKILTLISLEYSFQYISSKKIS